MEQKNKKSAFQRLGSHPRKSGEGGAEQGKVILVMKGHELVKRLGLGSVIFALMTNCASSGPRDTVVVQTLEYRKTHQPIWTYPPELRKYGRPENGYALSALSIEKKEQKICHKVLAALNEPRSPQPTFEWAKSWYGRADAFIVNRYSVGWTYFDGNSGKPSAPSPERVVARAIVDIDNDGKLDTVYRIPYGKQGITVTGLLGRKRVYTGPETSLSLEFFDSPNDDRLPILPYYIGLDQSSIPEEQRTLVHNASYGLNFGQFVDVLRLKGATFVLIGGSYDAAIPWHPVPLRLLYLTSYGKSKLLCEFVAVGESYK